VPAKTTADAAETALGDLVKQLERVWDRGLVAVLLYGSGAGGEHIAGRSDYNVLVLVDGVPLEKLRAAEAALRSWRSAGHSPPQIMTVEEWRTGADAFPMEYADILARHRVLTGDPPFAGIAVRAADLRLQLEHQARATLQRLRRRILAVPQDTHRDVLADSVSPVMIVFRASERLHGATPPVENDALARAVAARVGFDPEPFVRAVRHVRSAPKLSSREATEVLSGYLAGLERLVTYLDAYES
jgi:hypothetical protein